MPRTRLSTSDEFFEALEAETDDWPVVQGRAVLRVPPRHVHDPGRDRRRATGAASSCCTTWSSWPRSPTGSGARRYPAAELERALADAADAAVPRHPARQLDRRGLRGRRARPRRDRASRGARCGRPRSRRWSSPATTTCRSTRSASRAARWPSGRTAGSRSSTAPAYGIGRGHRQQRPGAPSSTAPTASSSPTGSCVATLGEDGTLRSLLHRASGREALAGPGEPPRALRRPARQLGCLGHRPVPPGDRRGLPARRVLAHRARRPAARRGRVRARASARAAGIVADRARWTPRRGASRSTATSSGTRRTGCCACTTPSPCTRPTRPSRCSSASRSARPTTPRATTWRATRCPAIAGPTSRSPASGSRCSATPSTATPRTAGSFA